MPYLILGIALVVGLVLVIRGLVSVDPRRAVKVVRWILVGLIVAGVLYFAFTRGVGATVLVASLLFPVLLRWRGLMRLARNLRGPSPGHSSDVETAYLRMSLDHDSGVLDGTVLAGRFEGRRLSELRAAELMDLLRECRVHDEPSATILEAYLDRVHGAGWRGAEDAGAAGGGSTGGGAAASGGPMTRAEAYEILGLAPGAGAEEIKAAHHRLMLKLHPDQGGSNYLASKINQAKDLLLGG